MSVSMVLISNIKNYIYIYVVMTVKDYIYICSIEICIEMSITFRTFCDYHPLLD